VWIWIAEMTNQGLGPSLKFLDDSNVVSESAERDQIWQGDGFSYIWHVNWSEVQPLLVIPSYIELILPSNSNFANFCRISTEIHTVEKLVDIWIIWEKFGHSWQIWLFLGGKFWLKFGQNRRKRNYCALLVSYSFIIKTI
jgi:hypothetical protein